MLFHKLQTGDYIPLFLDKIRILVEGEYQGIRLYKDTEHVMKWCASYINIKRTMRAYEQMCNDRNIEYNMTKTDWIAIFRWKEDITNGTPILRGPCEFPPSPYE